MQYMQTGEPIVVGGLVMVEGNMRGRVVCDFDHRRCLDGYEEWLIDEELVGGGDLSSGIMVETDELGFLHYSEDDADISKLSDSHG